jgi:hypothetical protein
VSAGHLNAFGHPHPMVLERLSLRGAATFRTDLDGLITLRTDGYRVEALKRTWGGGASSGSGRRKAGFATPPVAQTTGTSKQSSAP